MILPWANNLRIFNPFLLSILSMLKLLNMPKTSSLRFVQPDGWYGDALSTANTHAAFLLSLTMGPCHRQQRLLCTTNSRDWVSNHSSRLSQDASEQRFN